jgi:hypothetical protein
MKTNNKTEYDLEAEQFLKDTNTDFKVEFVKYGKHFEDDTQNRDIYEVTFTRGTRSFNLMFGQSINQSLNPEYRKQIKNRKQELLKLYPSAYDVLACLSKYEVGTFEDFCSSYGYDVDSRKAERIYKAVLKEYNNVCLLWTDDEIAVLQEIQ